MVVQPLLNASQRSDLWNVGVVFSLKKGERRKGSFSSVWKHVDGTVARDLVKNSIDCDHFPIKVIDRSYSEIPIVLYLSERCRPIIDTLHDGIDRRELGKRFRGVHEEIWRF